MNEQILLAVIQLMSSILGDERISVAPETKEKMENIISKSIAIVQTYVDKVYAERVSKLSI